MNISQISDICTGCGSCVAVCPSAAIRMQPDEHGFLHPAVDAAACTDCGLCACKCPVSTPPQVSAHTEILTGYANDEALLPASSSGAIFPVLASEIIRRGGMCIRDRFQICAEQHPGGHLCAGEGGAYRRALGLFQRNAVSGGRTKELPQPGV